MEAYRKTWNQSQKVLRMLFTSGEDHAEAMALLLDQHASLHTAKMVQGISLSFEDEVLDDISEAEFRLIPPKSDHSIAWLIWHIARIEDVTMNLLVAGTPQRYLQDKWIDKLNSPFHHTGNAMSTEDIASLSAEVDLQTLRDYRLAVGRRTRQVVKGVQPEALKGKVDPERLQQVVDQGAVISEAFGIVDYWSRRDIAGLFLMPPTRHNFIHLNEAARIKSKIRKL
jgi:hypothetical protein